MKSNGQSWRKNGWVRNFVHSDDVLESRKKGPAQTLGKNVFSTFEETFPLESLSGSPAEYE